MKPKFFSQSGEPMTPDQRREWGRKRVDEARAEGATFHRLSVHPDLPDLVLHEGWIAKPEDQGERDFHLVLADPVT
ncbi:hypothetical protein [Bradyrhizobium sp. SBR1B]|uniref:hypothetical protein n=1 Tax=Bradyrhizobium sp. SBR1B TaxID=2663836 RepID=UPI00160642D5|nr:hypothetical protein [Bradyrhizobium sp. SBR1B]MBB4377333.1 hypothetical protein [Bradyrhizobium sp. SBR1B]